MKRLNLWLHRIEDGILVAILLAMILLAGADILARTLFNGGIIWAAPVLRVMVLWVGLLGALLATRSREHISIDLLSRLLSKRPRALVRSVGSLFAAVVCGLLAWHAQEFVKVAWEFGDTAFSKVPAWPLQLIIPISFYLMALRFALQTLFTWLGKPYGNSQ